MELFFNWKWMNERQIFGSTLNELALIKNKFFSKKGIGFRSGIGQCVNVLEHAKAVKDAM